MGNVHDLDHNCMNHSIENILQITYQRTWINGCVLHIIMCVAQ